MAPALPPNLDSNPFAVLSLIAAPAILTNATSVLIMSTSTRLARAIDLSRELSRELEEVTSFAGPEQQRKLRELAAAGRRALLILRALRSFYLAIGCFAVAALLALLGTVAVLTDFRHGIPATAILGLAAGCVAISSIVYGLIMLLGDTRLAVTLQGERAAHLLAHTKRLADADQP
ncbi:MAG: hypothetical protein RLZZ440_2477 [Planctomycetota bacterium]